MGEGYSRLDTFEQPAQSLGAEQAWGAAAEKDRAQFPAIHRLQVLVEIGQQSVDVLLFRQLRAGGMGVEIAIRAFAYTPRNVNVQRPGRQHWQRRPRRLRRWEEHTSELQ